jgi:hypothetical protein
MRLQFWMVMEKSLVLVRLRPWRFLGPDGQWTKFLWRARKFESTFEAISVALDHDCLVFGDWQLPKYMALEVDVQVRELRTQLLAELERQVESIPNGSPLPSEEGLVEYGSINY